ncbi:hypothetical protein AB0M44_45595 [Streptosporangium subroseum]|uniref:hypothetical protein n=1 Tax=Streptosporangium subroseum TaxID=106412 RepID=UPI00342A4EB9
MAVLPPFARKSALIALCCSLSILFASPAAFAHDRSGKRSPISDAGAFASPTISAPPAPSLPGPEVSPSAVSVSPADTLDGQENASGASALLLVGFGTLALIGMATWLLTLRRERPDNTE